MKAKLAKWGNSLAVRIPRPLAESADFRQGDRLSFRVARSGVIRISKAKRGPTLAQLIRGITSRNLHRETTWGRPAGNELW